MKYLEKEDVSRQSEVQANGIWRGWVAHATLDFEHCCSSQFKFVVPRPQSAWLHPKKRKYGDGPMCRRQSFSSTEQDAASCSIHRWKSSRQCQLTTCQNIKSGQAENLCRYELLHQLPIAACTSTNYCNFAWRHLTTFPESSGNVT